MKSSFNSLIFFSYLEEEFSYLRIHYNNKYIRKSKFKNKRYLFILGMVEIMLLFGIIWTSFHSL